ncbi:MAG: sugar phosphate nucleotidyltransferase [Ignavibacteria bacterium]|nr:sugar phosphate nucleotidyltransferase [Ignavibacteria bacterium]
MDVNTIAIVMAGGQSPALWPKSSEKLPKQFQHFIGNGTLLQNTIERILKIFPIENIFVVTSNNFSNIIEEQLPELPKSNVIYEPFARHTLPCVSLALTQLSLDTRDETVFVLFPSDHHIANIGEFYQTLEVAIEFARSRDAIVAIGVTPTRPETHYGYIQIDRNSEGLEGFYEKGIRFSKTFAEKPDYDTARRFLSTGEFLWNTGIYVMKVSTFWNTLKVCSSEIYNYFTILKKFVGRPQFEQALLETFRQIQSESIDTGIMERTSNVYAIESGFTWSDVGTWDEIYRLSLKDADNNCLVGDIIAMDTKNCLIQTDEKPIAVVGVEDLLIIDSKRALLICKRGLSDRVGEIVSYLRRKNAEPLL